MTEEKAVVYAQDAGDGIRVIYLNQPKKKNAISAPMMDILSDLLRAADDDDDVRVVVLRGAGENFSSGGDLNQGDGGKPTPEQARKTLRRYLNAVRTIRAISKPVMCMVDGYAVGGAFALAQMKDWGLVNRLFPADELEASTLEFARQLSAMPDASIQITKTMMNALADETLAASLEAESTASPFCTTTTAYAKTMERFAK